MGGSAPKADKNIGIAAMKSAETGQAALEWMKQQAQITNNWATEDRARYKTVFEPLQDQFIAEAKEYASPERRLAAQDQAAADVAIAAGQAGGQRRRQMGAMGVRPDSGRFINAEAKAGTDVALATAGARNLAGRTVDDQGRQLRMAAINLGQGMGVNPGTSIGLSNGSAQAGFGAAMQGYGQQGSLLNADFQNRMQAYQANQGAIGGLFGALGTVAGSIPWASSEDIKTDKKPYTGALGAVRDMRVEEWTYKPGEGDGGTHVGPYAEEFSATTGMGDGKTIDPISAIGIAMGAIKELADKVDALSAATSGTGGRGGTVTEMAARRKPAPRAMGAMPEAMAA